MCKSCSVSEKHGGINTQSGYLLDVHGLEKHRGSDSDAFSVSVEHMQLERGEFCALVGPSGSGKSTLLDMLALVVKPTSVKRFLLRGQFSDEQQSDVFDIKSLWNEGSDNNLALVRRRCLGYVLQNGGLFPFLSVGENIDLPRRLLGLPINIKQTESSLATFGLEWGYNKSVNELSGGERQRVAILRALSHQPSIVLADEPTAAVDQTRAREIVALLCEYAKAAEATVIMVTHDVGLLPETGKRMFELQRDDKNTEWTAFKVIEKNHDQLN